MHLSVENAVRSIGRLGGMPSLEAYAGREDTVHAAIDRLEIAMEGVLGAIGGKIKSFFSRLIANFKLWRADTEKMLHLLEDANETLDKSTKTTVTVKLPKTLGFKGGKADGPILRKTMADADRLTKAFMSAGIVDLHITKEGDSVIFEKNKVSGLTTAYSRLASVVKGLSDTDGASCMLPSGNNFAVATGAGGGDFQINQFHVTISTSRLGRPAGKSEIAKTDITAALKSSEAIVRQLLAEVDSIERTLGNGMKEFEPMRVGAFHGGSGAAAVVLMASGAIAQAAVNSYNRRNGNMALYNYYTALYNTYYKFYVQMTNSVRAVVKISHSFK
jgi:hypothetical protein